MLLYKNWESVKAFGASVWNGIVFGVQTAIAWFSTLLENPFFAAVGVLFAPWLTIPALVVKTVINHWQPIKAFFAEIWGNIFTGAQVVWGLISGVFIPIGNAVVTAWQGVKGFFSSLWGGVLDKGKAVGAWFTGIFNKLGNKIISVWQPVKTFFQSLLKPILKVINFGKKGLGNITSTVSSGWNKAKNIAKSGLNWLTGNSQKSGQAVGQTIAQGVKASTPRVAQATYGMVYAAGQYLPRSDADKGPLSKLTESGRWWRPFSKALKVGGLI